MERSTPARAKAAKISATLGILEFILDDQHVMNLLRGDFVYQVRRGPGKRTNGVRRNKRNRSFIKSWGIRTKGYNEIHGNGRRIAP